MNSISDDYQGPMDRRVKRYPDIGTTVHEGEGKFHQSVQGKIWRGATQVDLQLEDENVGNGKGIAGYSDEARAEIRRLAEMNKVNISSVHAPLDRRGGYYDVSGLTDKGFNEHQRQHNMDVIRRTIDFAGDIGTPEKQTAVTFHLGEFRRPESEVPQKKGEYEFELYPGREYEDVIQMVEKNGQFIQVPKGEAINFTIRDPITKEAEIGPDGKIKIHKMTWFELNDKHKEFDWDSNKFKEWLIKEFHLQSLSENVNADEAFIKALFQRQLDAEVARARQYKSQADYYDILGQQSGGGKSAEIYAENARSYKEGYEEALKQIKEAEERRDSLLSIKEAGLKRTSDSIARLAIYTLDKEREVELGKMKRGGPPRESTKIVLAPENWAPSVYGSEASEIIEIIDSARNEFVRKLTNPSEYEDPAGRQFFNYKTQKWEVIKHKNEYYNPDISKEEAERIADEKIRITFDTNHIGHWLEHFKKNSGETDFERKARFDKWYMSQVEKLTKGGYIANVHVVDGMEASGMHLPPGTGRYPIKEAVQVIHDWATKHAADIGFVSEGHIMGPDRQLTDAWEMSGKTIYGAEYLGAGHHMTFGNLQNQYITHAIYGPTYAFGEAVTNPEDYKSWSEVPFE